MTQFASLRRQFYTLVLLLALTYAGTVALWVAWFTPRTLLFADLQLQRLQLQPLDPDRLPADVSVTVLGPNGSRDTLQRVPWELGERFFTRTGSARLLDGRTVELKVRAPRGIALLVDGVSLTRVSCLGLLLAAFTVVGARLGEELLASRLERFRAALRARRPLPNPSDRDLQPVVATFNQMLARLQEREDDLQHSVAEVEAARRHKAWTLLTVSHDLRTPLTVLTARHPEAHGPAQELLQRVERILEWSRLQTGRLEFHWEEFELQEALEQAFTDPLPCLEATGPVLIRSDFHWLRRFLEGLLARYTVRQIALREGVCRVLGEPRTNPEEQDGPLSSALTRGECEKLGELLSLRLTWLPDGFELRWDSGGPS